MTSSRHPLRSAMIALGIFLIAIGSVYLAGGLLGLLPLEMEQVRWNNIRIISGVAILGCLMAAIGYGNE